MFEMMRAETWRDVLSLLGGELTPADRAGGWTDDLKSAWHRRLYGSSWVGSRFLPSDAARLLGWFGADGITEGPIVEALVNATHGIPGVATPETVATAVKDVARGVRRLGFKGSTPHLQRELGDGTLHLVHLQRINAGVTGREPGFTVNLNVVNGALRRAWRRTGDWRSVEPVRSGSDVGIATRLGQLAFGDDHWWRPSTDDEAHSTAVEVVDLMESYALPWFEHLSDPQRAIDWMLRRRANLLLIQLGVALLVELDDAERRSEDESAVRRWAVAGGEAAAFDRWTVRLEDPPRN
jgi:hypothetical protein